MVVVEECGVWWMERRWVREEKRQVVVLHVQELVSCRQRLLPLHSCLTGSDLTAKLCNHDARRNNGNGQNKQNVDLAGATARTGRERSPIAGQSRDRVRSPSGLECDDGC
jgi:hypothetical protein